MSMESYISTEAVLDVISRDASIVASKINRELQGELQPEPIECGKFCLKQSRHEVELAYPKMVQQITQKVKESGAKAIEKLEWRTVIDKSDPFSSDYATVFAFIRK